MYLESLLGQLAFDQYLLLHDRFYIPINLQLVNVG